MKNPEITTIAAASSAAAALAQSRSVRLAGGRAVDVRRLSWLQFEAAWAEIAPLIGALAALPEQPGAEQLAGAFADAPSLVLRLCALSTGLAEPELAGLSLDDVLMLSAAMVQLNFVEGAGVRDFFAALLALPGAVARAQ
jgi:hypothetical protein